MGRERRATAAPKTSVASHAQASATPSATVRHTRVARLEFLQFGPLARIGQCNGAGCIWVVSCAPAPFRSSLTVCTRRYTRRRRTVDSRSFCRCPCKCCFCDPVLIGPNDDCPWIQLMRHHRRRHLHSRSRRRQRDDGAVAAVADGSAGPVANVEPYKF